MRARCLIPRGRRKKQEKESGRCEERRREGGDMGAIVVCQKREGHMMKCSTGERNESETLFV